MQPFGEATLGKAGLVVIPIIVACSTFGSANGGIYTSSRSMFGAAKDRLLPDVLSGLHTQYRTPVPAIIYLVSLIMPMYSKCTLEHALYIIIYKTIWVTI